MFKVVARPSKDQHAYSLHNIAELDPTGDKTSDGRSRCHGRLQPARNPRPTLLSRTICDTHKLKRNPVLAMPTAPDVELLTNRLLYTTLPMPCFPAQIQALNFDKSAVACRPMRIWVVMAAFSKPVV